MKLYGLILAALTSLAAIAVAEKPVSAKIDFNRGWSFMKCPAEWPVEFNEENKTMEPVILPHTWNAEDMGPGLTNPYIGSGWYRKVFVAPELHEGQRLLVEFEGVNNCHKVWVNGTYAGGVWTAPYRLDITNLVSG